MPWSRASATSKEETQMTVVLMTRTTRIVVGTNVSRVMIVCASCSSMSRIQDKAVCVRRHTMCAHQVPSLRSKPSRHEKRTIATCTGAS
eukprot:2362609-Amphidinium_carterae.1